jgi:hypothetical protein
MKPIALLAVALLLPAAASAQQPTVEAERARIRAERSAEDARFNEDKHACRAKFAVTDCMKDVTRTHNAAMAELRRQEHVLNDAERRRKAAEHQRELDDRQSPQRQKEAAERRARALEEAQDRQERAEDKAAKRSAEEAERAQHPPRVRTPKGAPQPQGDPRAARESKGPAFTAQEQAKNRAAYEERLREAQAHQAEVARRAAERKKPAASDLPLPK